MRAASFVLLALVCAPSAGSAAGFNGPYVGLEAGYASGQDIGTEFLNGVFDNWTTETSPQGGFYSVLGGLAGTFDDNLFLGVEADYEFRSADDGAFYKFRGVTDPDYAIRAELLAASSYRVRMGYVFNDARTLAYLTVGVAAIKIERTYLDNLASRSMTVSHVHRGWVAGLGLEQRLGGHFAARLEYRYADYGDVSVDTSPLWVSKYVDVQDYDERSVRLGVVYRF